MKSTLQKSNKYFENLKNLHLGKRGFVIGNGPNLKIEDLSLLKHDITIASNKIFLAFDKTKWRPTYYTIADPLVWEKIKYEVSNYFSTIHIPSYLKVDNLDTNLDLKIWQHSHPPDTGRYFSNDCAKVIYGGGTITFENLQIAVHLGLNPIYLVGCDHFYKGENPDSKSKVVVHNGESNHFIENYRTKGEEVFSADIDFMNRSYSESAIFAKKHNIQIINASRKSKLLFFDRCEFSNLFQ